MSAVTLLGTQTFNTTSGTHTVVATPAVGDLIVIVVANTGSTTSVAPTDNNGTGTYSLITSAVKAASADTMRVYVRNTLIAAATSTTFTQAPGTTTGGGLAVFKITGCTTAGMAAIRQSAIQSNQAAAGTPTPVFPSAALTTSSIIGAVFNATSAATMTPRGTPAYTERFDVGYSTPTTGIEAMTIDSGETGTSIAWGSTSASAFCSLVVEVINQIPPTVALNTPADTATGISTTPTLNFTATDANGDTVEYNIQVDTVNTFDSNSGVPLLDKKSSVTATFSGQVSASSDDAHQAGNSTSAVITDATDSIGTSTNTDSPPQTFAVRFTNVTIPQGATINTTGAPQLTLMSNGGFINIVGVWYGEASDNAATFSAGENLNSRTKTTATVALSENISRTAGTFYGYPTTGDWSAIIQEIVNRAGWVSGNSMVFICQGTAASSFAQDSVRMYDDAPADGAKLSVSYVSVDAGFTAGHPFASGVDTDFTVQAGDALTAGVTYFWRARATDPSGSNTYGAWATARSFTTSGGSTTDNLAAESDGLATVSATLADTTPLAATSAGQSAVSASLADTTPLAGRSDGQSAVAGALSDTTRLATAVSAQSAVTAATSDTLPLAATSAGQSGAAGTVTEILQVASAIAGQSVVIDALSDTTNLSAALAAQSALVVAVSDTKNLVVTVTAQSALGGTLSDTTPLTVTVAGASTVGGTVTEILQVATTVSGLSAVIAALADTINLSAISTGQSSVIDALANTESLAAAVSGSSAVTDSLSDTENLATTVAGQSVVTDALSDTTPLAAIVSGVGTVSGSVTEILRLLTTIAGQSTVSAFFGAGANNLSATITGQSAVAGALSDTTTLSVTITGQSAAAMTAQDITNLAVQISGLAALSSHTSDTITVSVSVAGVSSVGANLTESAPATQLDVTIRGLSSTAAALSLTENLVALLSAQSSAGASVAMTRGVEQSAAGQSTVGASLANILAMGVQVGATGGVTATLTTAPHNILGRLVVSNRQTGALTVANRQVGGLRVQNQRAPGGLVVTNRSL